jgi:hypothetical protein
MNIIKTAMRLFVVFMATTLWMSSTSSLHNLVAANSLLSDPDSADSAVPHADIKNLYTKFEKIRAVRAAKFGLITTTSKQKNHLIQPPLERPLHLTSVTSASIQVGSLTDGAADPSLCSTAATCTLRSAWAKCLSFVASSTCTNPVSCTVVLPTNQTLAFDGTHGALSVTTPALTYWRAGCPTTPVTLSIVGGSAGSLPARIVGDASSASLIYARNASTISLALTNVAISKFGDLTMDFSGALYVDGLRGFSLDQVTMSGCNGINGGAVYLSNIPGVTLTGSTFKDNRLLNTDDNPVPFGAALQAGGCQVHRPLMLYKFSSCVMTYFLPNLALTNHPTSP